MVISPVHARRQNGEARRRGVNSRENPGFVAGATTHVPLLSCAMLQRELGLTRESVGGAKFARGRGCEECNFTGFRGRMALSEIMRVDERLRQAVLDGDSTGELIRVAQEGGMQTLRQAGLRAIFGGETTVEVVLRETIHEAV